MRRKTVVRRGWLAVWGGNATLLVVGVMLWSYPATNAALDHFPAGAKTIPAHTDTPVLSGNILFRDDFATYSNRWRQQETPKASVGYYESALNMRIIAPGVSVWSVPSFDVALENYSVEVSVDVRDSSLDSLFGFVLRYRDDESFYALIVGLEGKWHFLRREGSKWIELTPDDALPLERDQDAPITQLRVDVVDGTFTFSIDDHLAGEIAGDEDLPGELFGLIAFARKGYIDVSFDDIVVIDIAEES